VADGVHLLALRAPQLHQLYLPPTLPDYSCSGQEVMTRRESLYGVAWQRITSGTHHHRERYIHLTTTISISTAEMTSTPSEGTMSISPEMTSTCARKVTNKGCCSQVCASRATNRVAERRIAYACGSLIVLKEVGLPCCW